MKLGDLCSAPCLPRAPLFDIPQPGCVRKQLVFGHDGRDYYAVLLRNHDRISGKDLNPRIAVVGLSPAGNQVEEFVHAYRMTGDYYAASIAGAFSGLTTDIVAMIRGLGLADKLRLRFDDPPSLNKHPDVYVTSLIACASLGAGENSDDFDPNNFPAAGRCVSERFVAEMCNPAFSRLSHILVLGTQGCAAMKTIRASSGRTVLDELRLSGKTVLNLPHPSGQNQEYVKLASLSANEMPSLDEYIAQRWNDYARKPPRKGRNKEPEAKYKAKRASVWRAIYQLRQEIDGLMPADA